MKISKFWPYAHRYDFIFVHFRLFSVFDFGLAHYASEPFKYQLNRNNSVQYMYTAVVTGELPPGTCVVLTHMGG